MISIDGFGTIKTFKDQSMKKITVLILSTLSLVLVGCTAPEKDMKNLQGADSSILIDGTYIVNSEASTLYWQAYKAVGGHMGGIDLERGELIVQNGQPHSGSFLIDMTSITNTDIENDGLKMNLINHLKSDDFFAVADYPVTRFDITRVLPYEGEEDYDYVVEGDLSIRDVTDSIKLYTRLKDNGNRITAYGKAEVDRTKFNIKFRSGSFFENLGDQLIKDIFVLEMDLVADRM